MSTSPTSVSASFDARLWQGADEQLGLNETPGAAIELPITTRRRRGFTPQMQDPRASVSLHDDDGVLRWVYEPPPSQSLRGRARRAGLFGFGHALTSFSFQDVGPNQVTQGLTLLDGQLTPHQGLRQWLNGILVPAPAPQLKGRTLLLV
ncbi:hypothetical protein, partial [Aquabacterium sp.]|uniref:hypothetical protein n=1 Tax=Aquabacterium sp. TaxID=1872578 RepID=UPI002D16531C